MRVVYILIAVMLYALQPVHAQASWRHIAPQYELEHIRLNNREDIGFINDIQEDQEGYFWLGGQKGLYAFDGNQLVKYNHGNERFPLLKDSLPGAVVSLVKDNKGNFWVQEEHNRCYLFNPDLRKTADAENRLAAAGDEIINYGIEFRKQLNLVTVNKRTNTLSVRLRTGKDRAVGLFKTTMNTRGILNYLTDSNNHWIFKEDSILRISANGSNHKWFAWPFKSYMRSCIYNNNLFVADGSLQLIYTWNPKTDAIEPWLRLPVLLKDKLLRFSFFDDNLYLADNVHCYILSLKDKTIQDLSADFLNLAKGETPEGLSAEIRKFIRKSDGSLYICTSKNLYRLKKRNPARNAFEQQVEAIYKVTDAISYRGLAEDDAQNIYVTYYNGISVKRPGHNEFVTYQTSYAIGGQGAVYHLNHYKGKLYWNNAAIDLKTGRFELLNGIANADHTTQYISNDTLWFFPWHNNVLYSYDLKHGKINNRLLDKNIFNDIGTDEMNDMTGAAQPDQLWISTRENGLMLISKAGKLLKKYISGDLQLSGNFISELQVQDSLLWFGCNDGLGMLNLNTGRSMVFRSSYINSSGIFQNRVVYSMLQDERNNLYLGTNAGLLYFDTHTLEFYNLPQWHPLSKMEFNRASAFRSSSNMYYFGSTDGLFAFSPNQLEFVKSSAGLSPVKLYSVAVFNSKQSKYTFRSENLGELKQLVLQPYENNINLNFSMPEFSGKVYYAYRVKGFGDQWTDFKPENASVTLYGLQPGDYTLEMKACKASTEMTPSIFAMTIHVNQVWYKRGWVVSVLVLTLLAGISLLVRNGYMVKIERQNEMAALRTRISSDLHDDVGTILSGLAMQSQVLAIGANPETKNALLEISSKSRDAMERMRDTVWAIDSRKDKFENLVNKMRDFAEKNLALKNITHDFVAENIEGKKFISPEKRQNIYLIFKEAITNIMKHSDCRHVNIRFAEENDALRLTVHDNGSEKAHEYTEGTGLTNMNLRAEKINGSLRSYYKNGFWIELTVRG